jgi:hypothetical protein
VGVLSLSYGVQTGPNPLIMGDPLPQVDTRRRAYFRLDLRCFSAVLRVGVERIELSTNGLRVGGGGRNLEEGPGILDGEAGPKRNGPGRMERR